MRLVIGRMSEQNTPQSPVSGPPVEETIKIDLDSRAVIVLDRDLAVGQAANAAGILAATLGALHPGLVGRDLLDGSGGIHPGLMPSGLTVLAAAAADLPTLRLDAIARGLDVVDFPAAGQRTNDYEEFLDLVGRTQDAALDYVGVAIAGGPKSVRKLTGRFPLFT